ncbi:hypothetical protein D918_06357 [Trichuris suis]|nr:hypothetical protein D918_06357 [Trichuris suis]
MNDNSYDSEPNLQALTKRRPSTLLSRDAQVLPVLNNELSSPYEMSSVPIERQENMKALSQHMNEKSKAENAQPSVDANLLNRCTESQTPGVVAVPLYRPDADINYQRVAISGEEVSGVPLEDLRSASEEVIKALRIREKYMLRAGMQFPVTVKKFLNGEFGIEERKVPLSRASLGLSFHDGPDECHLLYMNLIIWVMNEKQREFTVKQKQFRMGKLLLAIT